MLKIQRLITPYNRTKMVGKKNIAISIHYVGAVSNAYNNALYFYKNDLRGTPKAASANYFVDPISIWQSVEDFDASWSVGAKTYYNEVRNSNSISIEMCCKKTKDGEWYFDEQTVKNTIDLVRYLKDKYGITKIYRHWDITRKKCPAPLLDEAKWQEFLSKIEEKDIMNEYEALDYLVEKGRITNKDYWLKALDVVKDLNYIIMKWANDVKELG